MCHQSDCGCEHHACVPRGHHRHQGCGGDYHGHPSRRFPGREELLQEMGDYLTQLRAEVSRVEARLAELKNTGQ